MNYRVVFSPEAVDQIASLYRFIATQASPNIAFNYTQAIVNYCESMTLSPNRGTKRDDVRAGLRVTHYKKRAVIAFAVATDVVYIIGVFYGGQDNETHLADDLDGETTH